MKTTIEVAVNNKEEAEAIRKALADPVTKATVVVIGLLLPLSAKSRQNIMNYVVAELES